jgi:hypothetical protein
VAEAETALNLLYKLPGTRRTFLVRVFLVWWRVTPALSTCLHITIAMRDSLGVRDETTHGSLVVLMCAQEVPHPGEEEYSSGDGCSLVMVYEIMSDSVQVV